MNDGFIKVGAASPVLRVSDPAFNCDRIIEMMRSGAEKGVKVLVFPELSITGYTAQDLFFQKSLRKKLVLDSINCPQLNFLRGYPLIFLSKAYSTLITSQRNHHIIKKCFACFG